MQEFSNNRRNVVARLGSADRHIILGAHYDGQAAAFLRPATTQPVWLF